MTRLRFMQSYINQFGVHRVTAYQALKDACDNLFARQFSYQSKSEKGNIQNHRSRWVSEIIYIDTEATVKNNICTCYCPTDYKARRTVHQV